MTDDLRNAIVTAAEMRSQKASWHTVAAKVQRSPETCRQWPRRYAEIWNNRDPRAANECPPEKSPRNAGVAVLCPTANGRSTDASPTKIEERSTAASPTLRDVQIDMDRHPAIYKAAVARVTFGWKARGYPVPLPPPLLWATVKDVYARQQCNPTAAPLPRRDPGPRERTVQAGTASPPAGNRTNRNIVMAVVLNLLAVGLLGFQIGHWHARPLMANVHYANRTSSSPAANRSYNSRIRPAEQTDMRVAHFDCFSGISGDMTLSALVDVGVEASAIKAGIESLGLPIQIEFEKVKRNGFAATYANITAPEEETHRFLPDVEAIIQKGKLTTKQRELALAIFRRLAAAEATVHGHEVDKVHFHEVGALDSIADIVGAAIGLDLLGVDKFTSRSAPPGSGTVKCAHGIMPVPTPATAELLKGVPLSSAPVKAELVTPTGAAILTTVVTEYTDQPVMTIEKIGCGAGKRDFWEQPNILRLFVGAAQSQGGETDTVTVLETNLDNVSPEIIGHCFEQLFTAGALDVFTIPIHMKKNRPGVLLSVIADADKVAALETILFRETETFGIRRSQLRRTKLQREAVKVDTPWGPVKAKKGWREGLVVITPEYEDCARLAREKGVALREIYKSVQSCR